MEKVIEKMAVVYQHRENCDKNESYDKMVDLKKNIKKLGLDCNHFVCEWTENGESFEKTFILVPHVDYRKTGKIARQCEPGTIVHVVNIDLKNQE